MTTADTAVSLRPAKGQRILVAGKPVRLRFIQMIAGGLLVALCGAALIAGLYFNVLQVNWHVHIASVSFRIFYLKHWWDSTWVHLMGVTAGPVYRHGVRDLGEPAIATIAVKTIMAKAKWWGVRVGPVRLIATPFILLAVTIAMAVGGIWLIDFFLPGAWHSAFGGYYVQAPPGLSWLYRLSIEQLLLGLVIGLVLHRIWAPAGATLQGDLVDRSTDRSRLTGRTPLWVRHMPFVVQLRERWAWQMEHDTEVRERGKSPRWLITTMVIVMAYLVVTGFIAIHWVGTGHSFPYLAP